MEIQELIPIDYAGQRVITSSQLAQVYDCNPTQIRDNFRKTKNQFEEGVHYFKVEGAELKQLKETIKEAENFRVPAVSETQSSPLSKMASSAYLWTYQGCVRHCKMLNTQKAWDMFSEMERIYFGVLESEIERATVVQEELPFAQRYSAAARRSVARDFKESKKNAAPATPALTANPQLADKLIAIADKIHDDSARDKILIHAANLLVGQELF